MATELTVCCEFWEDRSSRLLNVAGPWRGVGALGHVGYLRLGRVQRHWKKGGEEEMGCTFICALRRTLQFSTRDFICTNLTVIEGEGGSEKVSDPITGINLLLCETQGRMVGALLEC